MIWLEGAANRDSVHKVSLCRRLIDITMKILKCHTDICFLKRYVELYSKNTRNHVLRLTAAEMCLLIHV